MREFKPQIRLPDDHGPNPYDSSTPFQTPRWATWQWWLSVLMLGTFFGVMAYLKTTGG